MNECERCREQSFREICQLFDQPAPRKMLNISIDGFVNRQPNEWPWKIPQKPEQENHSHISR